MSMSCDDLQSLLQSSLFTSAALYLTTGVSDRRVLVGRDDLRVLQSFDYHSREDVENVQSRRGCQVEFLRVSANQQPFQRVLVPLREVEGRVRVQRLRYEAMCDFANKVPISVPGKKIV